MYSIKDDFLFLKLDCDETEGGIANTKTILDKRRNKTIQKNAAAKSIDIVSGDTALMTTGFHFAFPRSPIRRSDLDSSTPWSPIRVTRHYCIQVLVRYATVGYFGVGYALTTYLVAVVFKPSFQI